MSTCAPRPARAELRPSHPGPSRRGGRPAAGVGVIAVLVVVALLGLAGCGHTSSSTSASGTTTVTFEGHPISPQAHLVCQSEAANDLAEALSTKPSSTPRPGWSDGAYTCTYAYADGARFVLSVKDFESVAAASQYRQQLAGRLGRSGPALDLGTEGAFVTAAGNAVVQKDHHVLVVDVSGVPTHWPTPSDTHESAARTIAATIMGCWMGGAS